MRKSPILLFAFLIAAVGAAAPKNAPRLAYDLGEGTAGTRAVAAAEAPLVAGYPPCRPGRGDDRCIQLYESRVRAALPRAAPRPAMGGPLEGPADYPQCSRLITDECVQLFDRAQRPARAAPARRPAASQGQADTPGI
jgi:hypothetical protein